MRIGANVLTLVRIAMNETMLMSVLTILNVAFRIWIGREPASRLAFSSFS